MSYYQFNLTLDGTRFIRGIKISQSNGYFAIQEPTFHGISTSMNNIKFVDNKIYLSTNEVACYFEIEKN